MSTENEIKQCPACGEDIKAIAKKCKHCGEIIDSSSKEVENVTSKNEKLDVLKTKIMAKAGKIKCSIKADYNAGGWKQLIKNKAVIVLLVSFVVLCMMLFGGDGSEILIVKEGTFNGYPTAKIVDVLDANFSGSDWDSFEKNGKTFVSYEGDINSYLHKKACDNGKHLLNSESIQRFILQKPEHPMTKRFYKELEVKSIKVMDGLKNENWSELKLNVKNKYDKLIREAGQASIDAKSAVDKIDSKISEIGKRTMSFSAYIINPYNFNIDIKQSEGIDADKKKKLYKLIKKIDLLHRQSSDTKFILKFEDYLSEQISPILNNANNESEIKLKTQFLDSVKKTVKLLSSDVLRLLEAKEDSSAFKAFENAQKQSKELYAVYSMEHDKYRIGYKKIQKDFKTEITPLENREKLFKERSKKIVAEKDLLLQEYVKIFKEEYIFPVGSKCQIVWELHVDQVNFELLECNNDFWANNDRSISNILSIIYQN